MPKKWTPSDSKDLIKLSSIKKLIKNYQLWPQLRWLKEELKDKYHVVKFYEKNVGNRDNITEQAWWSKPESQLRWCNQNCKKFEPNTAYRWQHPFEIHYSWKIFLPPFLRPVNIMRTLPLSAESATIAELRQNPPAKRANKPHKTDVG